MPRLTAFFAFPSQPPEVSETIDATCILVTRNGHTDMKSWRENDVPGRFISEPILEHITASDFLVADITRLNFNVTFEIGYAIGSRKRVILTKNRGIQSDMNLMAKIGIFDTIGFLEYTNSNDLATSLESADPTRSIRFASDTINKEAPVFLLLPHHKGDAEIRLTSRIKKARLNYRSFDPEEEGRLPAQKGIDGVAASHGVVVPLLSSVREDAQAHNIRAAFIAGLATAMGKELLLVQAGAEPIPLDYRDLAESYTSYDGFDTIIANYAPRITERLQSRRTVQVSEDAGILANISFGASAAENEFRELSGYYLPIDDYYKCKRGEIQVVAGRKGSGKTALFLQLRDDLRRIRSHVVLDLKPEGFQLVKLKDRVLDLLEEGTQAHTVTAFWEYLLLVEICHKILKSDERIHLTNHDLSEPYRALAATYDIASDLAEGDFAERMAVLIDGITEAFDPLASTNSAEPISLSAPQITELIHRHDLADLRGRLIDYLAHKDSIWVLFDNLDKGWPPHGLRDNDLLVLRCLLDAFSKIERIMAKRGIDFHGIVFIRNDVYELLVASSPDRGKIAHAILDWQDRDALRELMRRRIAYSGVDATLSFDECWRLVFASHIAGEESSQYLIDRCLMRPRALIDLITACRSHAVNRGHSIITVADVTDGVTSYSNDIVSNMSFELQDVFPEGTDLLYAFLEAPKTMTEGDVMERLRGGLPSSEMAIRAFDLMLWYAFLGIATKSDEYRFIYDMGYSHAKMRALVDKNRREENLLLAINPAFWAGLEIA